MLEKPSAQSLVDDSPTNRHNTVMPKKIPMKIDIFRSYLAMIQDSPGTRMYRHFWCSDNGRAVDILRNGQRSCAKMVSSILLQNKLIADVHSTIEGTLKDMREFGWRRINKIRPGAVVVWEPKLGDSGEIHGHIGFAINDRVAISNSDRLRTPVRHHITYDQRGRKKYRRLVGIWWHSRLGTSN